MATVSDLPKRGNRATVVRREVGVTVVTRINSRRFSAAERAKARAGYLFVAPYTIMLAAFGIFPAAYIVYLAFVDQDGSFAGFSNFVTIAGDFRYLTTFKNILFYSIAFIVPSLIIAIGLSLLLRRRRNESSVAALQVAYYLPQGLIGAAGVIVWLFMLTPAVSPIRLLLRDSLGHENIIQVVDAAGLVTVLAVIAVWTSGNAILLMYAALKSVPSELLDAAKIDGANSWQLARYVELPLLKKWVAYTVILNFAAAIQVFAEPQLLSTATGGGLGSNWSPLQLAYAFAYQYVNFPVSAAMALQLLLAGILIAVGVIRYSSLFSVDI